MVAFTLLKKKKKKKKGCFTTLSDQGPHVVSLELDLVGRKYEVSFRSFFNCGLPFHLDRPLRQDCFDGVSIVDCDLTFGSNINLFIGNLE